MSIISEKFGTTKSGKTVTRYTLTDGVYSVSILNFGGIIQSLIVPDKEGNPVDVVLGFESAEDYINQNCYMGAITGRCANRIAGGFALVSGKEYHLSCNEEGKNHLHGGNEGFSRKIWDVTLIEGRAEEVQENAGEEAIKLTYVSPEGEEGYPGEQTTTVVYRLKDGALTIEYRARSSEDTICNLSNHAYFNLSGQASGTVENHILRIDADFYGETDGNHVIKKQPAAVEGTEFDFRKARTVGQHNYDHHYFCNGNGLRNVGEVYSDDTGIEMSVLTDMPGMQFYTGNFLKNLPTGKFGAEYHSRSGLCLETQYPPNAVNCPEFQQPLLKAGEEYRHVTVYEFNLRP